MSGAPDVVVAGLGAAGLGAAITAHDAGLNVLIVEKGNEDTAGGNSRVSGQVWFSPTDAKLARTHLDARSGDYPVADDVAVAWAEETTHNTTWIRDRTRESLGSVVRDRDDPYNGDGTDITRVPYGALVHARGTPGDESDANQYEYFEVPGNECGTDYNFIGGSMGFSRLWLTLRSCLQLRRIPIRYNTTVAGLTRDDTGRVTGLIVMHGGVTETISVRRGVILATGGFAANPALARNYLRLPGSTPWGSPLCTGDGLAIGQRVGADLAHPYNYMAVPGIGMPPFGVGENATPPDGRFITVGADGQRFADETIGSRHGKVRVRGMYDFHPSVPMWTIFDEVCRKAGPLVTSRASFAVGWAKQVSDYRWSSDNSAEVAAGWIATSKTIRGLAERLGIDPDGLSAEVERYNAIAAAGADDPIFGRPAASMTPLSEGPYYGYPWANLLITTLGGLRKDGTARVLDPDGKPIGGLFCAGDLASSYTWALSGGMALGDALAFGRIAGRQVAAERSR